jgi:putative DNA primase/helicase
MNMPTLSKNEALKQLQNTQKTPVIDNAIPQPKAILGARSKPDFPLHALPPLLRDAVVEVQAYVQAPTALIVSSVLGVASVICQGLYKVRRDNTLVSPLSLYLLSVAEPNERKSKIESYFRPVIEKWLAATLKTYALKHHAYEAETVAHEARRGAIERAIKDKNADSATIEKLTDELTQCITDAPEKPLSPNMLFGDATKEAISKSLDENYPSGGIISAEAGGILAGALTRDGLTGVLAMLNSLWSAEIVTINRSGDGDRVLKDVALTLSLAVQEAVITEFLTKGKEMARGIGFLARTLFCYPETTQGQRLYQAPPETNHAVEMLNNRLTQLIALQEDHIENGRLKRDTLNLADEAKEVWVKYYNSTEAMQCRGEALEYIRDVAGKTADNASRLAALFHILESDEETINDTINKDSMTMGCEVAEYYLHEALIYLESSELADEFKNAQDASERLISYAMKRKQNLSGIKDNFLWNEMTHRQIARLVPRKFSDKKSLALVLLELEDAEHLIGSRQSGKSIIYTLNPRLLDEVAV